MTPGRITVTGPTTFTVTRLSILPRGQGEITRNIPLTLRLLRNAIAKVERDRDRLISQIAAFDEQVSDFNAELQDAITQGVQEEGER